MESATQFIFQIVILIFSVVIHEVSHGYAALMLGDKTAQYAGRLTLNPVKHLDPFGSIILPALLVAIKSPFLIGWAKPVPYNPYNLRSQKYGPAIVGMAGPLSNLMLAIIFGLVVRFSGSIEAYFVLSNFVSIIAYVAFLNLMLALFNLVPIPPLDGSKVLFTLLSYRYQGFQAFLEHYGFFMVLLLAFFFGGQLFNLAGQVFQLITGVSLRLFL